MPQFQIASGAYVPLYTMTKSNSVAPLANTLSICDYLLQHGAHVDIAQCHRMSYFINISILAVNYRSARSSLLIIVSLLFAVLARFPFISLNETRISSKQHCQCHHILHNTEDHQVRFAGDPKRAYRLTNPRWQTAANNISRLSAVYAIALKFCMML